jgi:hypothetical protein
MKKYISLMCLLFIAFTHPNSTNVNLSQCPTQPKKVTTSAKPLNHDAEIVTGLIIGTSCGAALCYVDSHFLPRHNQHIVFFLGGLSWAGPHFMISQIKPWLKKNKIATSNRMNAAAFFSYFLTILALK